jgi:dTDP-glucose pyrophosphorylase
MHRGFLIPRNADVRKAMQQLESTELKTLFVVDEDNLLFGSLTDGDVRRWILGGGELDGLVSEVCNTDPLVATAASDRDELKGVMLAEGIMCIPVVDESGRVTDVLLWEKLFSNEPSEVRVHKKIDLPVVIMAGGFGTRLSPFTSVLPKPLIPIGGRTVIEMIIDAFTAYGVEDFRLSVNYKSRIIKSYFEELDPAYSVRYLYEEKPLGTAGSLQGLAGSITSDLIVTNCDVIVSADYHDLTRHHTEKDNDVTLVVSLKNYAIPYGVCEIENGGTLREIREKPQFNFLVNTGLYVLKPWVLDLIPKDELFHFTDLIAAVQARDGHVGVYPISDKAWIDTGEWAEYRTAVAALSADRRKAG